MAWVDMYNPALDRGVYVGSDDTTAAITWFHLELRPTLVQRGKLDRWPTASELVDDAPVGLNLSIVKLPELRPGESCELPPTVVHFHRGDWHAGADRYRRWADTWLTICPRPTWVDGGVSFQETGVYFPTGRIAYSFSDMRQMAVAAQEYGVETIHLIGWEEGGWDAGLPVYTPAPELGGWEGLRGGINDVHDIGGRVCLFVNFQWADPNTDWYRDELHHYAVMDVHGDTKRDGWGYNVLSDVVGTAPEGHKPTVTMICPTEEAFQTIIVDQFVELAKLGIDALSIDKLQNMYRCYNPRHTHRPGDTTTALIAAVGRICDAVRQVNPDILIVAEGWWDQFFQYLHGVETRASRLRAYTGDEVHISGRFLSSIHRSPRLP